MNKISLNENSFRELRELYNKAVEKKETQFKFQGEDMLTAYAKYVVEYMRVKFQTDVLFLKKDGEVYACFPKENYNKELYGETLKVCYAHIGQHGSVHVDYVKASKEAVADEYEDLFLELKSIGYTLNILNKK